MFCRNCGNTGWRLPSQFDRRLAAEINVFKFELMSSCRQLNIRDKAGRLFAPLVKFQLAIYIKAHAVIPRDGEAIQPGGEIHRARPTN
jgi:hypothetical protein